MKVVIFAGGYGTRLSELTNITPKPLIEIGDMPIIWHIMKTYSHYGYNDFIICIASSQERSVQYTTFPLISDSASFRISIPFS